MKPPTCKICGAVHWSNQPHRWTVPKTHPPRRQTAKQTLQELVCHAQPVTLSRSVTLPVTLEETPADRKRRQARERQQKRRAKRP